MIINRIIYYYLIHLLTFWFSYVKYFDNVIFLLIMVFRPKHKTLTGMVGLIPLDIMYLFSSNASYFLLVLWSGLLRVNFWENFKENVLIGMVGVIPLDIMYFTSNFLWLKSFIVNFKLLFKEFFFGTVGMPFGILAVSSMLYTTKFFSNFMK